MKTPVSYSPTMFRNVWFPAFVGCLLACAPLGASLRAQDPSSTPAAATKGALNQANPGGTVNLSSKEVAFVNDAGAGNTAEVKAAELALKTSQNQEVKDFAQSMVKDHGQANENLAVVAKNHNITFPPDAPAKEKALSAMLAGLAKLSGAAFDKAYVNHMMTDHEKDVAEYKKAAKDLKDEKLVEYNKTTTTIVEGHLKMAKDLQAKLRK